MSRDQASKVLLEAARLVELGWSRGAHARTVDGQQCAPTRSDAVSWCPAGAIWRAAVRMYGDRSYRVEGEALVRLRSVVAPQAIVNWNDAPGRTVDEVASRLRDAASSGAA